jgi:lysozyme
MEQVRINDQGIELIKSFEGLHDGDKTTPLYEPIRCPAGLWTLGWGNIYGLDGRRVTANHRAITLVEAEELLVRDLKKFESQLARLVRVKLSENQWSALTSFIYNVGSGNFQASTLRSCLNRGQFQRAADEFPKWRRAAGRILPGLVRRRAAERALFLTS